MKQENMGFASMQRVPCGGFAELNILHRLKRENNLYFLVSRADLEANCYHSDIWLCEDGACSPLTHTGDITDFWVGPDRLIFARSLPGEKAEGPTQLWEIETTPGALAREWLQLPWPVAELLLLPDDGFLFTADRPLQEDTPPTLYYTAAEELPLWQEGGPEAGLRRRLFLCRDQKVYQLTPDDMSVENLQLSSNGRCAYFVAQSWQGRRPLHDRLMQLQLNLMSLQDISWNDQLLHQAYCPLHDGTLVVLAANGTVGGLNENGVFYHIDPLLQKLRVLNEQRAFGSWPSVSTDAKWDSESRLVPCGNSVVWTAAVGGDTQLIQLDLATGETCCLTVVPGAVLEAELHGGQLYFTALRDGQPTELYRLEKDDSERQLTHFNSKAVEAWQLAQPLPVQATGSNGEVLEGWVLPPPAHTDGEARCPALLCIHGGPRMVYGPVFSHEMQYLAGRGYAVMYCNPTGSDGRGEAFGDLRGRYGTQDKEDLLLFVDAVLAACPWIDPERLGVMGGSYGGYMVNLLAACGRFAAGVSERSIANWTTHFLLSDIGDLFVPDQAAGDPWADANRLWANSPLAGAAACRTPLLFIQGENDRRCPPTEGLQMYAALRHFGVPARLCLFAGEGHSLARQGAPRARLARLAEIRRWLDRWLKPTKTTAPRKNNLVRIGADGLPQPTATLPEITASEPVSAPAQPTSTAQLSPMEADELVATAELPPAPESVDIEPLEAAALPAIPMLQDDAPTGMSELPEIEAPPEPDPTAAELPALTAPGNDEPPNMTELPQIMFYENEYW